jgi:hypothetical protein
MALEPVRLQHWVDRLRGELTPEEARHVGLAANLELAEDATRVWPAVYVARSEGVTQGPGNASSGLISQSIETYVDILFLVNRAGGIAGERAVDPLFELRRRVWQTIIGWTPPDCASAASLVRYSDLRRADSILPGLDRFRALRMISNRG